LTLLLGFGALAESAIIAGWLGDEAKLYVLVNRRLELTSEAAILATKIDY
jgi:hypothetical protein